MHQTKDVLSETKQQQQQNLIVHLVPGKGGLNKLQSPQVHTVKHYYYTAEWSYNGQKTKDYNIAHLTCCVGYLFE